MADRTMDRDRRPAARDAGQSHAGHGNYWRFFAMIATSTAVMLGLMYLNTYALSHVFWSETRLYMAFVMGASMAIIMLAYMLGMYRNTAANVAIFAGAAVVFAGALWLVRSQETVQDRSFMRAMIPHHSIAIMTSTRSQLSDPRVRALAEAIRVAQNREIAEMRFLIEDIARNGEAGEDWPLGEAGGETPIRGLRAALETPVIARVRPEPMAHADIERALGGTADCTFWRSENADPILAAAGDAAVMKVSGDLVMLALRAEGVWATDGARMVMTPDEDAGQAQLVFEILGEPGLRIGFDGHSSCVS